MPYNKGVQPFCTKNFKEKFYKTKHLTTFDEMNKVRPFIDETTLPINPFINSISIPVGKQILRGDKYVLLESSKYTKVYITSDARKYAAKMSDCAIGMLYWMLFELASGKDYIWVNKARYMNERSIKSEKTVNKALSELQKKQFIHPIEKLKDVYFINANFFYCGSRPNAYPNNITINE